MGARSVSAKKVSKMSNNQVNSITTTDERRSKTKKSSTNQSNDHHETNQTIEFINENRNFSDSKYKLYADLVPETAWYTNVRSIVSKQSWDKIRNIVYTRAGNACEICGRSRSEIPNNRLDCHERWSYSEDGVQKLERLLSLCVPCHMATHIGYWTSLSEDNYDKAISWISKVNNITAKEAKQLVKGAFDIWEERSRRKWITNVEILPKHLLII